MEAGDKEGQCSPRTVTPTKRKKQFVTYLFTCSLLSDIHNCEVRGNDNVDVHMFKLKKSSYL